MVSELEEEFDKYRIFGDPRDFKLFRVYKNNQEGDLSVPNYAHYMYPDVEDNWENKIVISPECAREAIKAFKRVLSTEGQKVDLLMRIDLTKPFDINDTNNQAALPLTSYYELKEARRTNPKKARQMEKIMFENMKIITDWRQGKISKKQFEKAMQKQRSKVKKL